MSKQPLTKNEKEALETVSNPELRATLLSLRDNIKKRGNICEDEESSSQRSPDPPAMQPVQLPLWSDSKRASPNSFLRSSLFPALHGRGRSRPYFKEAVLPSQNGYKIKYTGERLDQADLDVWLQCAHLIRNTPLGNTYKFRAGTFLKSIGRCTGKSDYIWLKRVLLRLQSAVVEIQFPDKKEFKRYNLLGELEGNDNEQFLIIKMNPNLIRLFANDDWTALQWENRKMLKGKALALWLHGFFSSHAEPYPIKIETLCTMCGSESKNKREFKQRLRKAFELLAETSGISAVFDGNIVTVHIAPSPSQAKYIQHKKQGK